MGHALPLLERMSQPSDIAIVNFGAWHGSGDGVDYQKLVREFADAVAENRERLPHFVWKEMVPTHYDQQQGLYPGEPVRLNRPIHAKPVNTSHNAPACIISITV